MTQIDYTYQVIRVDRAHGVMEVKYTSEIYGSTVVGMPLPNEGTSVEEIIAAYNPAAHWLSQELVAAQVTVGASGSLSHVVSSVPARTVVEKVELAAALRLIPHGTGTLWDAFKAELALADEETQEDWSLAVNIGRDSMTLRAVLTTLVGDQAQAIIDAIYDA